MELFDERMVLGVVMSQVISQMVQFQKLYQHQIKVNLFDGGNLRSVQPSPCHLVNIIAVQHQVGRESILLVKKDMLVPDRQKLFQGV